MTGKPPLTRWWAARGSRVRAVAYDLAYEAALRQLGAEFDARSIAPVIVKGQSIRDLAYPAEVVRIADDIDLLVAEDEAVAVRALNALGFREKLGRPRRDARARDRVFRHPNGRGPNVDLQRRLDEIPRAVDYEAIRRRSRMSRFIGLRYPEPTDLLLLVVLHATCSSAVHLERALDDLQHLVERGDVDLDRAAERAGKWKMRVAYETWMYRLQAHRGVETACARRALRSKVCELAGRVAEPLRPSPLQYLIQQAPWFDDFGQCIRSLASYTTWRVRNRLCSGAT